RRPQRRHSFCSIAVGLGQQLVNAGPERLPGFRLALGQSLQGDWVTHEPQVWIIDPKREWLADRNPLVRISALEDYAYASQIGLAPRQRLGSPTTQFLLVEQGLVLALPTSRQRRGARGLVAITGSYVVGQARLDLERLAPYPCCCGVKLLGGGQLGKYA